MVYSGSMKSVFELPRYPDYAVRVAVGTDGRESINPDAESH